jgi:6-phosphogluconate dehydrogenase
MKLGVIGLGKMGKQVVQRLLKDQHEVVVISSKPETLELAKSWGAVIASDMADLVKKLGDDPVVWIMIPSDAVENEMSKIIDLMPHGGTIVDGGNSDYRETRRRAGLAKERGVTLIDSGTSGGVLGLENGFSIMVGGDKPTVDRLAPAFTSLAAAGGWGYFGPAGAGHFVKMVHNAIEYGMMESLVEGYRVLKESGDYPNLNLAQVSGVWEHGSVVESLLNKLSGQVLRENPTLDGIDGYVNATGEAQWTLERAKEANIPMPAIQAAMDVRQASQQGQVTFATKLLAAQRNAFGGHNLNKPPAGTT